MTGKSREGGRVKPYFSFQWHITDDCDQRCKHCYIFAESKEKCISSMTRKQMTAVLENCEDFCETFVSAK